MSGPHRLSYHLHQTIGTALFTGFVPVAPGTAASALCLLLLWLAPGTGIILQVSGAAAVFFVGVVSSRMLEREWGTDAGRITIDEFAGMMIAVIGLPKSYLLWFAAFIAFRLFDILKPPPIRILEFLPGGWGVMADDAAAGIYANVLCRLLLVLYAAL